VILLFMMIHLQI